MYPLRLLILAILGMRNPSVSFLPSLHPFVYLLLIARLADQHDIKHVPRHTDVSLQPDFMGSQY